MNQDMKHIIIVCEGETEQEFVRDILRQPFLCRGILLDFPKIKRSNGGIVKWNLLKEQIERHLREGRKPYVTTFIDYYGISDKHQFPSWVEAHKISDKSRRIDCLQQAMRNDIHEELRSRFIPYIQLHEFEALLFIDEESIVAAEIDCSIDRTKLRKVLADFPDPETINNHIETSPSHRLEQIITGYNKVLHGNIIALRIGLQHIREKAKGFNQWLSQLESIV